MSTISVHGLQSLKGEIKIQGSKNASLPMMAAAILHKGTTVLTNVPRIRDVFCMMGILEYMGCGCYFSGHELTIDASTLKAVNIPESYVNSMRSSIMVLGALLGRVGEAVTYYPGGCSIGKRPIDLHLSALRCMGAQIMEDEDMIVAAAHLSGTEIDLNFPSVGATENALLAAVLADGTTVIRGAAKEPEIVTLCRFLNNMGANISGIGSDILNISGVKALHDSVFCVGGDRIVAGTYLSAVMAGTGKIDLRGVDPTHMKAVITQMQKMGADISCFDDTITASVKARPLPLQVRTGPYPAFPTDLQSPILTVMSIADGDSYIEETVFEGRFETAKELKRMGADITIEGGAAKIHGCGHLRGCTVTARDLRGGAALVVAGLAAEGRTCVQDCRHIKRGYEDICQDLAGVGVIIKDQDDKNDEE